MRVRILAGAAVLAAVGAFAACEDTTAPESITYVATLSGANERPTPNSSTATGTATYVLTGNTLTWTIVANGLTTPAFMAHQHIGGPAVAGPIMVPYGTQGVQSGTITTGSIDLSTPIAQGAAILVSGDSLRKLLDSGTSYANVHTPTFPGGEIRGQIVRQP